MFQRSRTQRRPGPTGSSELTITPQGELIVRQAQQVIEQTAAIKQIAKSGNDSLSGPLKLGIPPAGQAQAGQQQRGQGRDHAAAEHRPLFSRPGARGVPRVRTFFQRSRGHTQEFRRQLAGNHQTHGGFGHGHHCRAATERARRAADPCGVPEVLGLRALASGRAGLAAQFHAL